MPKKQTIDVIDQVLKQIPSKLYDDVISYDEWKRKAGEMFRLLAPVKQLGCYIASVVMVAKFFAVLFRVMQNKFNHEHVRKMCCLEYVISTSSSSSLISTSSKNELWKILAKNACIKLKEFKQCVVNYNRTLDDLSRRGSGMKARSKLTTRAQAQMMEASSSKKDNKLKIDELIIRCGVDCDALTKASAKMLWEHMNSRVLNLHSSKQNAARKDLEDLHNTYICACLYVAMNNDEKKKRKGKAISSNRNNFDWGAVLSTVNVSQDSFDQVESFVREQFVSMGRGYSGVIDRHSGAGSEVSKNKQLQQVGTKRSRALMEKVKERGNYDDAQFLEDLAVNGDALNEENYNPEVNDEEHFVEDFHQEFSSRIAHHFSATKRDKFNSWRAQILQESTCKYGSIKAAADAVLNSFIITEDE